MRQAVHIKYFHPRFSIGLEDVRNAWLIQDKRKPVKLKTIIYQGRLAYRFPITGKRISYLTLKKGLIKKIFIIYEEVQLLPF